MNRLRRLMGRHPVLVSWLALAIGMVLILLWAAEEAPLTGGQRAVLVVGCILLAGACARIIAWEPADISEPGPKGEHD
ncbi:MAG: hypothetical protein H5T69_02765 [Chloroflexi bacterium]|nr:hypothetical protein [Chloroflexota bacterium]